MHKNKIIDCITFFDNNFMFELRYNVLKDYVDILLFVKQHNHKGLENLKNYIKKF